MRVLVCGSRTYQDNDGLIDQVLDGVYWRARDLLDTCVLIHGGANGADHHAKEWAEHHMPEEIEAEEYLANWKDFGKGAGPARNQLMLNQGKPDLVLAFVDKPLSESHGTNDMVGRARQAGVTTYVIQRMERSTW